MILRRFLSTLSFALTALALGFALHGDEGHVLAMFIAGPSGLLALISIALLVAGPPSRGNRRMLEAQLAFGFSTAVLLFCNVS